MAVFELGAAKTENAGGDAGAENVGGVALAIDAFDLAFILGDKQRFDAAAGGDVGDIDQLLHPAETDKLVQHREHVLFRLPRPLKADGHTENGRGRSSARPKTSWRADLGVMASRGITYPSRRDVSIIIPSPVSF
ncbi:hypothetical protein AS026_26470 [Rhizobium altiplani]|uniref:Uncharacterized protein n=1 Tax=Rhizobium altiplani TaxID=1864509 RepID=A0A120FDW6_9HYPH|nr:hypothetical protein AS026_26470 [Rhizobium altiplani]